MRKLKKKSVAITGAVAALFAAPLIVLAVLYTSEERNNRFNPADVDIEVHEGSGDAEGKDVTNEYQWTKEGSNYSHEKPVQIKDVRNDQGEALRVCFVPMWYEGENICGSAFNFRTPAMNEDKTALIYTDYDQTITLNLAADWYKNGWSYSDPNDIVHQGDGCFYYTGAFSNALTEQLLASVELNDKAYELTEDYTFRLDVLADAVQTSAEAAAARGWESPTTTEAETP